MAIKQSTIAVVAGATGLVGQQLVKRLLDHSAYRRVIVFVRRELDISHPKLVQRLISYDQFEEALDEATMKDADVFCTLGTTIRQAGSQEAFRKVDYSYPLVLGKQAKKYGAAKLLIVTAMGSSPQSTLFYNRVKGELERDLKALNLPRLVIMQPSLMLGNRKEKRLGERAGIIVFQLVRPFLIGPLSQYRAVHSADVAQVMVEAARRSTPKLEVFGSNDIARKAKGLNA